VQSRGAIPISLRKFDSVPERLPHVQHGANSCRVLLHRKGTTFGSPGLGMNHGGDSNVTVSWNGAGGTYVYTTRSQSNIIWLDGHGQTISREYNDTTLTTGNWQQYWIDAS